MKSFTRPLCLLLSILAFSCEEEVNKPVFQTLPVSELNSEGVTLNGKFQVSGDMEVTNYGFVLAPHASPTVADARYSFDQKPEFGPFERRVTDGMTSGVQYYARAFIEADSKIIYSNIVDFTSSGSATPILTDFSPKAGHGGDTIVITGSHLGDAVSATSVKIGDATGEVLSVSREQIKFRLPFGYTTGDYPMVLRVADKTVTSTQKFTLQGPLIQSISPTNGPPATLVTISGSGFSAIPLENAVYFSNSYSHDKAFVVSATTDQLQVQAPYSNGAGERAVSVEYNGATGYSPQPYNLTGPEITSFSPSSGPQGTVITINGTGFSTVPAENTVRMTAIGFTYCTVLTATANQLVVELGNVNYSGPETAIDSYISVEVLGIWSVTNDLFTILGPSITSITPDAQYEGREITITGENFNPAGAMAVLFNNEPAPLINVTENTMTVLVPFGMPSLPDQVQISVHSGYYHYKHPHDYNIESPWEALDDFPGGARYGVTTFSTGGYNYVMGGIEEGVGDKKDLWRYDAGNNTWQKMADFDGPSRAFAFSFVINGTAYVGGGGHYGHSIYDLQSDHYDLWEYDEAGDEWIQRKSFIQSGPSGRRFKATGIGNYGYFGRDTFLYRYDPSADEWWIFNAPITFIEGGIAETIGDKGYFGLGPYNTSLHEYDPALDTWTALPTFPIPPSGSGNTSSFVVDGKLYAGHPYGLARFDPSPSTWTQVPNLPEEISYQGAFGANGHGYMVTGSGATGNAYFYRFNPNY